MADRRIGGPDGGSDKGRRLKPSGVVIAISVAVVLGVGGTSAAVGSGLGTSSSVSSSTSARGGARASERDSEAVTARLTARGLRVTSKLTNDDQDCAQLSYGEVRSFFGTHPCTALRRALIEVRDSKGDVVLVPIASVDMPSASQAQKLKTLLDSPGSGNITELSREKGRYRTVRFTGDAYKSRIDGNTVTNGQAQPVARGWSGLALTTIATNAVE